MPILHTPARIALARTGASLTTHDTLAFALAHAQARDAVHTTLSLPTLLAGLHARGLQPFAVRSAAPDRTTYLRRPDLGRRLATGTSFPELASNGSPRLAIVVADGLSALAVDRHALPLLDCLLPQVHAWQVAPVVVAEQARVALADDIAAHLRADASLILIGERPGLSSPDSLGAYITWAPHCGRTDAERNCISNIRHEGLSYEAAAARIVWFLAESQRLGRSGVTLKDPPEAAPALPAAADMLQHLP